MTVSLSTQFQIRKKLGKILDLAKERETTCITIMTNRDWHMQLFDFFSNHDKIEKVKVGANTIFIIKEMRIELKPIDFYI
jgi:hypothetical protein